MEKKKFSREIAYKTSIAKIKNAEESQEKPFRLLINQKKVSRVNLIGMVISKIPPENMLLIDDGSGDLPLYFFDQEIPENVGAGTVIQVVGRAREFNKKRYVCPEIIKIKEPVWLKWRQEELKEKKEKKEIKKIKEKKEIKTEEKIISDYENLLAIISQLDKGQGAAKEEVLEKIKERGMEKGEELIIELMKRGEIYEVKKGTIKLL